MDYTIMDYELSGASACRPFKVISGGGVIGLLSSVCGWFAHTSSFNRMGMVFRQILIE